MFSQNLDCSFFTLIYPSAVRIKTDDLPVLPSPTKARTQVEAGKLSANSFFVRVLGGELLPREVVYVALQQLICMIHFTYYFLMYKIASHIVGIPLIVAILLTCIHVPSFLYCRYQMKPEKFWGPKARPKMSKTEDLVSQA